MTIKSDTRTDSSQMRPMFLTEVEVLGALEVEVAALDLGGVVESIPRC